MAFHWVAALQLITFLLMDTWAELEAIPAKKKNLDVNTCVQIFLSSCFISLGKHLGLENFLNANLFPKVIPHFQQQCPGAPTAPHPPRAGSLSILLHYVFAVVTGPVQWCPITALFTFAY